MTVTISSAHRGARNNGTLALMDAGGAVAPAVAQFYGGVRPVDGGAASGDLLISAPLGFPSGVVQEDGEILLNAGDEVLALADGIVSWARIFNGVGMRLFDCDVSAPNGSGDLWLAVAGADGTSTQVWAGGLVQIASGTMG